MRTFALAVLLILIFKSTNASSQTPDSESIPDAGPGITAVSGKVVDQNGRGIVNVKVIDNATVGFTNKNGVFLLRYIPAGRSVLRLDATQAGASRTYDFGTYEIAVKGRLGKTVGLGFKSWLVAIDHRYETTISSPTAGETIVRTPEIPGLELVIAPGVVVRDATGSIVTKVSITAVPGDKLFAPLPTGVSVPVSFTIQPGGACLYSASGGVGVARIRYPNIHHQMPRARERLLRYEPDLNGWTSYGAGTVTDDGKQLIPDESAYITDFGSAECDPATRSHFLALERLTIPNTLH